MRRREFLRLTWLGRRSSVRRGDRQRHEAGGVSISRPARPAARGILRQAHQQVEAAVAPMICVMRSPATIRSRPRSRPGATAQAPPLVVEMDLDLRDQHLFRSAGR